MPILPVELIDYVLSFLYANSLEFWQELVVCASINKLFNQIVCKYMYKTVSLFPYMVNPHDHQSLFESLVNNPRLARYVKTFRCWDQDAADWLDDKDDEQTQKLVLSAFENMTELRYLSLTPCVLGEAFTTSCDDMRWTSLRELHICGANPLQYMWNPAQVSASGSLSNLSVLRWTTDPKEPLFSPFYSTNGKPTWTQITAFLVSVLEVCCPLLSILEISRGQFSRRSSKWKVELEEWMTHHSTDWDPIQSRMKAAIEAPSHVPCKLTRLRNLSLLPFFDDAAFLTWAIPFFAPQFSSCITSFRLGVANLRNIADQQSIKLVSAMGPNLQSLSLLSHTNDSNWIDDDPSYLGIFSSITTSPSNNSIKSSLNHLAITHPGPFNHALADSLKELSNLQSLSLNDYVEYTEDRVITNGGWLDWDRYHEFLYKFVQLLPASLEELEIVSNINTGSDPDSRGDGKVNGPAFCRLLPKLRRFHLVFREAWYRSYPMHETYVHRLGDSTANQTKSIATTYLQNRGCCTYTGLGPKLPGMTPTKQRRFLHRRIRARQFVSVKCSEDMMFSGEDEVCAWSYTQEDLCFIHRCDCRYPFKLADPYEGNKEEEKQMTLSDLQVN